tara:strand:+ start:1528 stop:3501 length:1974 start_codon:yes stop_codon:yes gene_type:complete
MTTNNMLPTDYQAFIHTSRYARWIEEEKRRETWSETVGRYINNVVSPKVDRSVANDIEQAILNLDVMPSMRAMMCAGEALSRDNTCGYNCSYTPIDHLRCFDEVLYILLNGTGVGFSVESKYISSLNRVPVLIDVNMTIAVEDSKAGWADAYRQIIEELYRGGIPQWDVTKVRPAGARLKTFGGRASGPAPLVELFIYTINTFKGAQGRKLTPLEVHGIMCKIGEVVVVGGVRRSAMISLSDLSDPEMRTAKSGEWYKDNGHFSLANNSVAYESKPSGVEFMGEWASLAASGSGERGIFNRKAAMDKAQREGIRDYMWEFGTNPCSEIVLRGQRIEWQINPETGEDELKGAVGTGGQFCNLTEVIVRATDSTGDISRKIKLASILGTIQATLTYFPYLRDCWKANTEEEALLGVSMTGIMDCSLTNGKSDGLKDRLVMWRKVAVDTNENYAAMLGINPAAAVSALKPSGTVSQLCSSSSGIHARHSDYYIRTVRGDNKDPLTTFLKDQGIPSEPCVMKPDQTTVFSFPTKSPVGSITRHDMTAVEQLEMWLMYQRYYTCHKPSVTVSVGDDEWMEVGAFVYKYFDEMSGVSFLPRFDHTYEQAPYQDCTEEEYEVALFAMPEAIDWTKLSEYELFDTTKASQTLACTGGDVCEMVDI